MTGTRPVCPSCFTTRVWKNGKRGARQQYRCIRCDRKFRVGSTAYRRGFAPEVIAGAIEKRCSGLTYQQIVEELHREFEITDTKISIRTAQLWFDSYIDGTRRMSGQRPSQVGCDWVIGHVPITSRGLEIWVVADLTTYYVLEAKVAPSCNAETVSAVVKGALASFGEKPPLVLFYSLNSGDCSGCGADDGDLVETVSKLFPLAKSYRSDEVGQQIPSALRPETVLSSPLRFLRDRRRFRSEDAIQRYVSGWKISNNFFRVDEELGGRTPAQAASAERGFSTWIDLVQYVDWDLMKGSGLEPFPGSISGSAP